MATDTTIVAVDATTARTVSTVSWAAIIAGAVVAAAVSALLLALGTGFGLASVSPWAGGASPAAFTVMTAIWLIVMQWIASGLGGYMTGRLRTRWIGTHVHEVFFRDTAHGFLTWALATVIAAGLFGTVTVMAAGAGVRAAAPAAQAATTLPMLDYDVDSLFRSSHADETPSLAAARVEAARILAAGAADGQVSADDRGYLAQRIATVTGTSAGDATQRVDAVVDREQAAMVKATQAADTARKAAAALSIFVGLSLLIGALIASVAAALGGQLRDEHP
jgi:hypothetical protein